MELNEFINTGISEGWVRDTGTFDEVFIDGGNRKCQKYDVRIDKLHYNVQNGRIATFVSRYKAEHGELPSNVEELDNLIEQMIENVNPKKLKTTKLDIKAKGQQETALVLSDGTVVDGNRRFTCLRMLACDEGQHRFMRCYVFPDTYDRKAIKALELEIQMGRDEKENYDEITRLVDIDECVNIDGLMTADEYAKHANIKPSEMKKRLKEVDILKEYLEFIGMPGAFHIAQDQKIHGGIESLAARVKKCKDENQAEDVKNCVYAYLALQSEGDRTRDLRGYIDRLIGDPEFMDEQLDVAETFLEKVEDLPADAPSTTEFFRDHVVNEPKLRGEQKASFDKAKIKEGNQQIKSNQVKAATDAVESLKGVDAALLSKLTDEQRAQIREALEDIRSEVARVARALDGADA